MQVSELRGVESFKALTVFHNIMLGLKMLPNYAHLPYEEFYTAIAAGSEESKDKIIREAILHVGLDAVDIESLAVFCTDPNGAVYRKANLKPLPPNEIFEIVVAVCREISKIKVDFVTESEKKKLEISQ